MERLLLVLVLGLTLAILATSCTVGSPTEEENGEVIVGYVNEFGTQVARYALDGECHCTSTGVDDDCEYEYNSASAWCNSPESSFYDSKLDDWTEEYGYIENDSDYSYMDVSCGFPFDYTVFSDGEMSLKFYGEGLSIIVKQLNVTSDSLLLVDDCYMSSGYGSCLITGIDLNDTSGYLFVTALVTIQPTERFIGVRVCYDPDSSD